LVIVLDVRDIPPQDVHSLTDTVLLALERVDLRDRGCKVIEHFREARVLHRRAFDDVLDVRGTQVLCRIRVIRLYGLLKRLDDRVQILLPDFH